METEREEGSDITLRDYVRYAYDDAGVLKWKLFSKDTYYFNKEAKTLIYEVYAEQYEKDKIKAKIWADKGEILQSEDLMRLTGNVKMITTDGKQLETEELTYNTTEEIVKSEKKVVIRTQGTVIRGTGFEADKNMDKYKILKPEAVSVGGNPLQDR